MRAHGKALKAAAQLVISPMSYLALARKWRPRTFSQLVGQEHINKALIKSLNDNRLHHAYIFTGTRGVGKTSIARLMAKALNCERGISATPCLECDACISIEQGRFIDLIEIDGASKTRVEDTRELMDNVQYAPTSGRYKIYLIDEVHMLSQHSFNALLKTLEEPPEHVKFLLATTDPQKLPATVLSRCLQFTLKYLPIETIAAQLRMILTEEQYSFEDEVLPLLARAAHGSMRDALSLLDQAIASSDNKLCVSEVKSVLGYTQQDYALQILQSLAMHDAPRLIKLSRQIASEGGQFTYVLDELMEHLHQVSICQNLPDTAFFIDCSPDIQALAKQLASGDVQLFYQIGIKGIQEIHLAPSLAIGFEMTLLRMYAFKPAKATSIPALAWEITDTPISSQAAILPAITAHEPATVSICDEPTPLQPDTQSIQKQLPERKIVKPVLIAVDNDWDSILTQIKLTGLAQNAAENASMVAKNAGEVVLHIDKGHQSLFTTSVTQRIEQALTEYYRETIRISLNFSESIQSTPAQKKRITHDLNFQEAEASLQQDPFLNQLKQDFSAEQVKNSIELL